MSEGKMKDTAYKPSTCDWPLNDPLMVEYHDNEWGVPVHDDRRHFEFMLLDCFQAGLSWRTVLHKRENFKNAFDHFDYRKVAGYGPEKVAELLQDAGIIRNKGKINASIRNAICFLEVQKEFGSFDAYIWQFTNGKTLSNCWTKISEIPPSSKESDAMSKDLVKRGFKFVGSTICYSYMQAAGMINDHLISCSRYQELKSQGQQNQ